MDFRRLSTTNGLSEGLCTAPCHSCNTPWESSICACGKGLFFIACLFPWAKVAQRRRGASPSRPVWNPECVWVSGWFAGRLGTFQGRSSGRRPNPPTGSKHGGTKMKMVKSAFLASAAGLVAMSGAQAADLPVKAKPVEYVKVCSLYGAGFYYIPGTDICMKIGGYVRFQQSYGASAASRRAGRGDQRLQPRVPGLSVSRPRDRVVRHPPADRVRHAAHVPDPGLHE